jgi:PAS domain S-box-containing protein
MTTVRRPGARIPGTAASIAFAGGLLVLAGWAFDIQFLKQPTDVATTMKPAAAAAFVAIGVSLWLQARTRYSGLAALVGGLVAVLGAVSFGDLVFGGHFSFDRPWLALSDPLSRMSPLTAFDLTALGFALAVSARPSRAWLAQLLSVLAMLVATIVAIGYLYRLSNLVGLGGYTTMAPHTDLLLLAVSIGILFLHPDHGLMAVYTSDSLGGQTARRILPATIAIPIGLGWLRLQGERHGWYDPRVGPPVLIVGTMILLSIVVWLNARMIARVDARRQDFEEELRRANESLEVRVVEKTAQLAESRAVAAESAEMFFQLFEFAPDALVAVDASGRIERTNIRAIELFGYGRGELVGRPVDVLVPDRFKEQRTSDWAAFIRAPHAKTMGADLELTGKRKDGSEFPVEIVLSPASSPHGPLGLAVIRDLTERRRTEALTRQAEERIQTGQRMEALGQLAGGIAHDFNNMMTVVTGYSELLLTRTGDDHPFQKPLQEIKKAGDRCANLTGHLLAFSRRQVLQPAVVDLGSIVADLNQMMPVLLGEAIAVTVTVAPDLWQVRTDQAQIEQVIVNLVVNARDAMAAGGRLSITVRNRVIDQSVAEAYPEMAAGEYVVLSVTDTGHGMDEQTRARVFDPFFTTKPVGQGSGLGLSTAYGFIKQSGGYIHLESELNKGTTVDVFLPRAASPARSVAAPKTQTMPGGDETILLTEDEASVRAFLRDVLGQAGYQLLEATDGQSAIAVAARHPGPIHLLISDIVMPGMNGGELADALMATRPDTRLLLISGYAQHFVVEHTATQTGAPFLLKPFTADELLSRVREILDARDTL